MTFVEQCRIASNAEQFCSLTTHPSMSDPEPDPDDTIQRPPTTTTTATTQPSSSSPSSSTSVLQNSSRPNSSFTNTSQRDQLSEFGSSSSTPDSSSPSPTNVSPSGRPSSPPPPTQQRNRPLMLRPKSMKEPNSSARFPSPPPSSVTRLPRLSTFSGHKSSHRHLSVPYPSSSSNAQTNYLNNNSNVPPLINLRRGATFYNSNMPVDIVPIATPADTSLKPRLRRSSTIIPGRPSAQFPSTSSSAESSVALQYHPAPSLQQQQLQVPRPRLRRGSTMINRLDESEPSISGMTQNVQPLNHTRDSSGDMGVATFLHGPPGPDFHQHQPLPRADTFAFGARSDPSPSHGQTYNNKRPSIRISNNTQPVMAMVDTVQALDQEERGKEKDKADSAKKCGMCGNCRTGLKALPPWAPERLKEMNEEERATTTAEFRAKQRMGKLDKELREERLKKGLTAKSTRRGRGINGGDGLRRTDGAADRGGRGRGRRAHVTKGRGDKGGVIDGVGGDMDADTFVENDDDRDIDDDTVVDSSDEDDEVDERRVRGRGKDQREDLIVDVLGIEDENDDDCGICDSLEGKVESLEQQLEVLREVVKLCSHNEAELQKERVEADKSLKRSKTWIGRIANPFQNAANATAASERSKLKEEVDVLRKATDFLFQKLEESSVKK